MQTNAIARGLRTPTAVTKASRWLLIVVAVSFVMPATADKYYVATRNRGNVGGISFGNEDILLFDTDDTQGGPSGTWSKFFDGSDVGIIFPRIDGFYVGDGYLLLSFADSAVVQIDGQPVGLADSDIVKFIPFSLGEVTAGTFEWFFDGSDVGFQGGVDALTLDENGDLIVSPKGYEYIPGETGTRFWAKEQDLVRFIGTTGRDTSGVFQRYLDGVSAGFRYGEGDIDAVHTDGAFLYLVFQGRTNVGSLMVNPSDILQCDLGPLPITTCSNPVVAVAGSGIGMTWEMFQGIHLELNEPPQAQDDFFTTDEDTILDGSANLLADNGNGADSDADGDPLSVTQVEGSAANVGTQIALPSGALLTVGADGSFSYDPNGQFDFLKSGEQAQDLFTYQIGDGNGGFDQASVSITIDGVNDAPLLTAIGNQSVDEGEALGFTATAIDAESDGLTFSLAGSVPAGASITAGGVFGWTPTEAQGPGDYIFDVVVTDDGTPTASDSETISVTVNEVNVAPVLDPIGDQVVDEQTELSFTATANDPDEPANALTFSLSGSVPAGASITSGGVFSWTPTEAQGPGSYTFDVVVTDDGTPVESDSGTVTVTVNEVNLPPVAVDHAYSAVGHVPIEVPAANGLLTGVSDPDIPANTVTVSDVSSASGATITFDSASGSFSYTSPPGFEGNDTFTYTVTDDGTPQMSDTATVTVTVNDVIWFIDNSAAGANSGTLSAPFQNTAAFNGSALPEAGDFVYLAEAGSAYTSGIVLENDQVLVGEGAVGASLENLLGIALPPFSVALPVINGSQPMITDAVGNGVTLAANNTIRGIRVGDTGGFGVSGGAVGTFTIVDTGVEGAGGALNISGGGTVGTVSFDTLSSTSSVAQGVRIVGVNGTVSVATGGISGAAGTAFDIEGGNLSLSYPGSITQTNTARGVRLANNGGTVTFRGGLNLSTGIAAAFEASGGGTVNVCATDDCMPGGNPVTNTVASTTGTAVNISGTTIGASGVTFRSVSANGANSGIVLSNTGNTGGGFTVTGDGSLAQNDSGGVIQNTASHAVSLNGANDVTLRSMRIDTLNNAATHGISSSGGSDILLQGLVVQNLNGGLVGAVRSTGWFATDLGGVNRIDGSLFRFFDADAGGAVNIVNTDTDMTSLTVDESVFTDQHENNGATMVFIEAFGTSNVGTIRIGDGVGDDNLFTQLRGMALTTSSAGSGNMTTIVQGNQFLDAVTGGLGGINAVGIVALGSSTHHITIDGNSFDDVQRAGGNAGSLAVFASGTSTMSASIVNNVFADFNNNGDVVTDAQAIRAVSEQTGGGAVDITIADNVLDDIGRQAIFVSARNSAPDMDVVIDNNTIGATTPVGFTDRRGIEIVSDTDAHLDVELTNNTVVADSNRGVLGLITEALAAGDMPTLNATVGSGNTFTNNDVGGEGIVAETGFSGFTGPETLCANVSGNTLNEEIVLDNSFAAGNVLNVTQASAAALGAANGGVAVQTFGTVTFGAPSCALPTIP